MLFTFKKELFDSNAIDIKALNKIWHAHYDKHRFYQTDYDDIQTTEDSQWFKELSEVDKILYQESVSGTIHLGDKLNVKIGETHTLEEAWHYLSEPLKIILENGLNDAPFLKSIFKCYRQDAKQITKKIEDRTVQFVMGGGSAIEQTIRGIMDSFDIPTLPKDNHEYLRCFVLLDSDKKYGNDSLKTGITNMVTFFNDHNISYHILEKREMENYLPSEAYSELDSNNQFIEAYLRLNDSQKDFFDLENGFEDINFDSLNTNIKELYLNLSSEDKRILRKQNLKNITSLHEENFKSEFPKLFNSDKVTKSGFTNRTKHQSNPNELKDIITKVRELL